MKILYLCSADLSGTFGSLGSVRHIIEVSENLSRLGNQVRLIVPGYARYPHQTPVRITYVPIIKVRFIRTLIYELFSPFFIIGQLIFWRPHIVYWRQSYLTIFPALLSRLLGKKILTEVNGLTIDEVESEPLSRLRKSVILAFENINYRASSHLICVAPQIRERILEHYSLPRGKASVILNGVNSNRMPVMNPREAKRKIGLDPDLRVVGFVGHFFPWDGIEYLIEAAPRIIVEMENVHFLVVGHGLWGEHLPELASKKGLTNYFTFTGKVPWERLYLYVNAFDVATAPYSKAINFQSGRSSLKILEYFACKKPVVASQTEVIPEVVDLNKRGLGITVRPEDPVALADAILRLLRDRQRSYAMGKEGRAYVEGERSWEIVARKTQHIMQALIFQREQCAESVDLS
jgi:glycosyltransferase involved in cell wall biosynthesis